MPQSPGTYNGRWRGRVSRPRPRLSIKRHDGLIAELIAAVLLIAALTGFMIRAHQTMIGRIRDRRHRADCGRGYTDQRIDLNA